nr:MAG TPA: hypothetical protein [Bacteriophage sp.]
MMSESDMNKEQKQVLGIEKIENLMKQKYC